MNYYEKLKDPRWQMKRLNIFNRDNFTCQKCGDATTTLHIHHLLYRFNADPWDYLDKELQTVCENCHREETIKQDEIKFENIFYKLADKIVSNPFTKSLSLKLDRLIEKYHV